MFIPYIWHPGVFERSSPEQGGFKNPGYHAFRNKEQAERETSIQAYWLPCVIGSVAMWGEVIEHENGWRSEYAAVRSLTEITGDKTFAQAIARTARKVPLPSDNRAMSVVAV